MQQSGYFRYPSIHGDLIVFVCEDDLWRVPSGGGVAVRLTSNLGEVSRPIFSPCGKWIAYTGREEGHSEVYVMPATGGAGKRLTFFGALSFVVGWSSDGTSILYASNNSQPFRHIMNLYKVSVDGGVPERLDYGIANAISFEQGKSGVVLGRNTSDPARWKRYRGGTAGVLWIDKEGLGEFQKLTGINGNLADPMWIGDRIYFISDHEGIGDIYSCTPSGTDVQRHTHSSEFYVRHATSDGKRIVYHQGGDLFLYDTEVGETRKVEVEFYSQQTQRQRKFVSATRFLEDFSIHPDGHSTLIITRGKPFVFGNWEGATRQIGEPDGVRYRLAQWLHNKEEIITVSDAGGEEFLEVYNLKNSGEPRPLRGIDVGRPLEMEISPVADKVALANHRFELIVIDAATGEAKLLDKSEYNRIAGISWSPDGKWIAYGFSETIRTSSIKLCNVETGEKHILTAPNFRDFSPSFDPEGKFIYFLSFRDFNPVYDSMHFDLGFPNGMRPYLISLKKNTPSPFIPTPKPFENDMMAKMMKMKEAKENKEEKESIKPIDIDFEGIQHRIAAFPVPEGRYHQIIGIKGKAIFSSAPLRGSLGDDEYSESSSDATIEFYDFETNKRETLVSGVSEFKIAGVSETLIYRTGQRLRVIAVSPSSKEAPDPKPSRKSGWLDLERAKVSVLPTLEWKQMYREVWRLQREHFWTPDMSKIDWERVYQRYLPVIDKVSTRSEYSDLVWEVQGELGTSHAYEMGGDYRKSPMYRLGFLAADVEYDSATDSFVIKHIVRGDSWSEKYNSPLNQIGIDAKEGDRLIAVNGRKVGINRLPEEEFVNQANCEITLTLIDGVTNEEKNITIKTLDSDTSARYREWVENNRRKVHTATGGRVGYVHIPNMGPFGYAEFHRYYLAEIERESLVIDVRFNGGGHVSQLILEKLARKRIGYDMKRWGKPEAYPSDSVLGPIIALTNEYAGSDGDIFSHCFKLMKLGTLVGKRTWGGVIGIWPRHSLVDGSVTTQPEFSFWFNDVGWSVENYGTDPDVEVEIAPQDYKNGLDTQLDTSIELILAELEKNPPVMPNFSNRPNLALP